MSGRGGRRLDPVTLTAGLAALALGALLALDRDGSIALGAGWIAVAVCAAAGSVLVVSGLVDRRD
jgi:hypothetical protein